MVICEVDECDEKAKYGVKQIQVSRCKEHKKDGMVTSSKYYCEHNRLKFRCRTCGGSQICEHDKRKDICRKCNGSAFCEHDKRKSQCKECKGSQICEHDKRKAICRKCKGSSFCEHGIQKHQCLSCKGASICKHDKLKSRCRECEGSSFCEHDIRKSTCRKCQESSFCSHNKQKSQCISCKGASVCKHAKRKYTCWQCSPESNNFCKRRYALPPLAPDSLQSILTSENSTRCPKVKQKKYDNYCTTCFVDLDPNNPLSKGAHLASKELKVLRYLTEEFPGIFTHNRRLILSDRDKSCTIYNRRIDFQTEVKNYVFCIEVDENQHKYYDPLEEEKRIMQIYENANRNMVFIRFNPDKYKQDGKLMRTSFDKRLITLGNKIREVIDRIESDKGYSSWFTEIKMFFDDHIVKINKQKILCSGITKKDKPCRNGVTSDNKFCYLHRI